MGEGVRSFRAVAGAGTGGGVETQPYGVVPMSTSAVGGSSLRMPEDHRRGSLPSVVGSLSSSSAPKGVGDGLIAGLGVDLAGGRMIASDHHDRDRNHDHDHDREHDFEHHGTRRRPSHPSTTTTTTSASASASTQPPRHHLTFPLSSPTPPPGGRGGRANHQHRPSSPPPPRLSVGPIRDVVTDIDIHREPEDVQLIYTWVQSAQDAILNIVVPPSTIRKDVTCRFGTQHLFVSVAGMDYIDGATYQSVDPELCTWELLGAGEGRRLSVTLHKAKRQDGYYFWPCPVVGHPESMQPMIPGKRDDSSTD